MRVWATGWGAKWTSVLAVLLLLLSSLASACELQCNLARAGRCCAPHEAMKAMPGMEQGPGVAATLVLPDAVSCLQHVCSTSPALPAERSVAVAPSLSFEAVKADQAFPVIREAVSSAFLRGPPRLPLVSPVSLHILSQV